MPGGLLHELTRSLGNFQVLEVLERIGNGRESSLTEFSMESVSVVIFGLSILGLSYGLTPSELARGKLNMASLMVRRNIYIALQYHQFVIGTRGTQPAR